MEICSLNYQNMNLTFLHTYVFVYIRFFIIFVKIICIKVDTLYKYILQILHKLLLAEIWNEKCTIYVNL